MAENPNCTVYVGNLDERVCDRVLYDILIQAGRVVDLHIPRDKETDKPKGFAFAKYETEEIADYAVKLFSGLVTLYNRTLKFAISGQDKPSNNLPMATPPTLNIRSRPRPYPVPYSDKEISPNSVRLSTSCWFSEHQTNSTQVAVPPPPGVSVNQSNGYGSPYNGYRSHYDGNNYDYDRRVFGAALDSITRSRLGRYDARNPSSYPSY
ncbi:RNA-binding protein 7 isoform X1 [Capsicum chacoense]|uniref:RNA-binding protein 7 isoform X1 n=1 Tax=Capsicum annuum TaxID=4072 RepID=UPI0007BF5E70|nr:RNA-binding protein 7 isoform X1 [Capsicum annuum]KAF3636528.1 putative splicing factor 3B subunit 4-like isoform X2 [Capsicum annuum]KAF3666270.1 putative splicing factor 3B subunit 4-like isoform X2 [Capsicum annuum]